MFWAATLWLASTVLIVAPVHAAELTVLSGNGAKAAVTELAARFERATGHTVSIHFEVNPTVRKMKVNAGVPYLTTARTAAATCAA